VVWTQRRGNHFRIITFSMQKWFEDCQGHGGIASNHAMGLAHAASERFHNWESPRTYARRCHEKRHK